MHFQTLKIDYSELWFLYKSESRIFASETFENYNCLDKTQFKLEQESFFIFVKF